MSEHGGIPAGSREERCRRAIGLRARERNQRRGAFANRSHFVVADDPDDLEAPLLFTNADASPDRILAGPVSLSHGLVDDVRPEILAYRERRNRARA